MILPRASTHLNPALGSSCSICSTLAMPLQSLMHTSQSNRRALRIIMGNELRYSTQIKLRLVIHGALDAAEKKVTEKFQLYFCEPRRRYRITC